MEILSVFLKILFVLILTTLAVDNYRKMYQLGWGKITYIVNMGHVGITQRDYIFTVGVGI